MKLFRISCFLLVAVVLLASACNLKPERSLVLATTTSTYDSGLLDGREVEVGPTEELFSQARDPRTRAFINGEMVY